MKWFREQSVENTSNSLDSLPREMYYYRQRYKNAVFSRLQRFFTDEAAQTGLTKSDIAKRLRREPSQISRWLQDPNNLTLETLSDLLFAMGAEPAPPVFIKLAEQKPANYMHPLISQIVRGAVTKPPAPVVRAHNRTSGALLLIESSSIENAFPSAAVLESR